MARIVGWKSQKAKYGGDSYYTRYGPGGLQKVKTKTIDGVKYRMVYQNGVLARKEQVNRHPYGDPRLATKSGNNYIRGPLIIRKIRR